MNKLCSVDGCTTKLKTTRYCAKHYYRMSKHGSTDKPINAPMQWLLNNTQTCSADQCLFWPFYKDKDGYALVTVKSRSRRAHRLVCEGFNGQPTPEAPSCLHRCGNGYLSCVNPHHLYWGSQAANCADRISHAIAAGKPASPRARLSKGTVVEIRSLLARGEARKSIAESFGVSVAAIHDIAQARSWQHIIDDQPHRQADLSTGSR